METRYRRNGLQLHLYCIFIGTQQVAAFYLRTRCIQFDFPLVIAAEILQISIMRCPQHIVAVSIRSAPAIDLADTG